MGPKKGKNKDKKDGKIKISLWINKTAYKYGCLCTFCKLNTAILHCPDCPDFLCKECDISTHAVAKRAGHIRSTLSKLDLKAASGLVTRYVRLVQHLKNNIVLARSIYRRYFDMKTLCHYYYNSKYGYVTWRKPYCLRQEELFPFYTEHTGASKIQCVYHLWKCRVKVCELIRKYYRKIFDRAKGRFYYTWLGKSTLLPKSSWYKPKHFGKRGYMRDILPIFTKDVAAVIIQRKWRTVLTYRFLHALVRASYDQLWDPVTGAFTYYHLETEILYRHKPKLLGSHPWDPNFIPGWGKEEVKLFLRRIGMKKYAQSFYDYEIDGKGLLLLDDEDFENLEIDSIIHRKKIKVETKRVYGKEFRDRISEAQTLRRENIRKFKLFSMACRQIQCVFRGYLARKDAKVRRELIRLEHFQGEVKKEVERSGIWWTDRDEIPTRRMLPFNLANKFGLSEDSSSDLQPGVMEKLKGGGKTTLKLPAIPLKLFGRKRDHKTVEGWGRLNSGNQFEKVDISAYLDHKGRGAENFSGTDNISRAYSWKLYKTGYDKRRAAKAGDDTLGGGELKAEEDAKEAARKAEEAKKKKEADEAAEEEEGEDDTFQEEDDARAKKNDLENAAKM